MKSIIDPVRTAFAQNQNHIIEKTTSVLGGIIGFLFAVIMTSSETYVTYDEDHVDDD